jgi:hypothetical protein
MKPAMQVEELQYQSHILSGSNRGAKSTNNSEDINWKTGGFVDEEYDY